MKGAFSRSVGGGGGISDSESRSLMVSLGVDFLRPQKLNTMKINAERTMTTPTTIPAIAPAGRPEERLEEAEEDPKLPSVAMGTEKVFVVDTVKGEEVDRPGCADTVAVGSEFRKCQQPTRGGIGGFTSSEEHGSITKPRGNIKVLPVPHDIPNISIRLCRRCRRIRIPSLQLVHDR